MPLGQNIIGSGAAALAIGGRVRVRGGCYFEFAWDGELEIHDSSETCWLERLQAPFRRPSVQNIRCIRHGSLEESKTALFGRKCVPRQGSCQATSLEPLRTTIGSRQVLHYSGLFQTLINLNSTPASLDNSPLTRKVACCIPCRHVPKLCHCFLHNLAYCSRHLV